MQYSPEEKQRNIEQAWSIYLARGKEQLGNHQANMAFLDKTNLIRPRLDILEIGCGIGTIVHELTQKDCRVVGIDISRVAIAYGRKKYPRLNLQIQPAEKLDFPDQSFDLVISFDLIEHMINVDQHLKEVKRVLRNQGWYLLGTPNKYSNALYETIVFKNFRWKKHHPSLHTPEQLKKRIRKHGFEYRFVKINSITDFTINKMSKLGRWTQLVKFINISKLPLFLQINLYLMIQKCDKLDVS